MPRPDLYAVITWDSLQESVLAVFTEALRRLACRNELPRTEDPINFVLYRIARDVHLERQQAGAGDIPFFIARESTSQPEPDDTVRSGRLDKIPDFSCQITNPQATEQSAFQLNYYVECKRLGRAVGTWVLNSNYSANGIRRFVHLDWQYAKGCAAALMIGYIQDMDPEDVLTEVNAGAKSLALPLLSRSGAKWLLKDVTSVEHPPLIRTFPPLSFPLKHAWVDLRHCTFTDPPPKPSKAAKKGKKARNARRKVAVTKPVTRAAEMKARGRK